MAMYNIPHTEEDLLENFEQLHPIMDASLAASASARCLYCYDAPCVAACPSDVDIPLFIKQIGSGNIKGAAKTIYSTNYFGQICGKVCPTKVLCEGACVHNEQDIAPVEIGSLQTYACNEAIRSGFDLVNIEKTSEKAIAVIGAGPAGIACACELCVLGYHVDVYEAKAEPSGLALHGTAPYKILNDEVREEVEYLRKQFGFNLILNTPIDDPTVLEEDYDAIFIGIGLGQTRDMNIPGEDLSGVHLANDFIERVKLDALLLDLGPRVVVIGGGNTAMDAASEAARLGTEMVILAYRRDKSAMSAYAFEYELTQKAGVESLFNVSPLQIHGEDSVDAIEFVYTKEVDGELVAIKGSEFVIDCDAVIKATGQEKLVPFLSGIEGLKLDSKGRIEADEFGQTTNPMYFAAGDAVNGGAEVVNAVAEGKAAGKGIDRWLRTNANSK